MHSSSTKQWSVVCRRNGLPECRALCQMSRIRLAPPLTHGLLRSFPLVTMDATGLGCHSSRSAHPCITERVYPPHPVLMTGQHLTSPPNHPPLCITILTSLQHAPSSATPSLSFPSSPVGPGIFPGLCPCPRSRMGLDSTRLQVQSFHTAPPLQGTMMCHARIGGVSFRGEETLAKTTTFILPVPLVGRFTNVGPYGLVWGVCMAWRAAVDAGALAFDVCYCFGLFCGDGEICRMDG